MIRAGSDCFSLGLVTTLSLRDLVRLKDDDRGGGAESEVFSMVTLVLLGLRSGSEDKFTLDDAAEGWVSLTTGNFGTLALTFAGTGTVLDRLFEVE